MDDNELVETVDDNDEDESKFEGTTSLAHLARECTELLSDLARAEESNAQDASQDLYWASRQWAEYNVWCNNVGTRGEGVRSVDVRLKDVPEICKLLGSLLRYLRHDLQGSQ